MPDYLTEQWNQDDLQFKAISGQFNVDEAEGIVECFVAAVGNKDSVGDIVAHGAFDGSLRRRKPRVVWGHDWNQPIGKVLAIDEVAPNDPRLPAKMRSAGVGGLLARVQFNLKSERGREAFASVAFFGEDQEWSIGYKTVKASYDPAAQANVLQEVELFEVSPVLHGANQLTGTISVKSADYEDTVAAYGGDASEMNESNRNPGSPVKDAESAPMKRRIRLTMGDDGYGRFMDGAKIHAMEVDRLRQSLGNSGPTASDLSGEGDHPGLGASLSRALGSQVNLRLAGPNFVVFDRQESDGDMDTYFLAYHEEQGRFMFGEPMEIEVETVIRLVPEGHGDKSIESFTKGTTGAGRWLRASEANMRIVNAELALTQGRKDV